MVVLMLYISTDDLLIDTDRGHEVSACPKRVTFVQSVRTLDLLLEPSGGLPFYNLHGVGDGVAGCGQDAEVYMIILNTQLHDFPVFPFADRLEDSAQLIPDLCRREHFPSVLGCPDNVVF